MILLIGLSVVSTGVHAQTFVPVPVTGWKQDVIADTGTNPAIVTTAIIDGKNISDHVLYTKGFATRNSTPAVPIAGGIPDNGTIVSGNRTYQFEPFDKPNAVYMTRGGASVVDSSVTVDTFTLKTPGRYSWMSFMTFSTEGVSAVNVDVLFTDGTKERTVTNFQILDWYSTATTTTPVVYSGSGRMNRNTGAADGATTLPRYYGKDFMITCPNQEKLVQAVIVTDTTVANNQPRALIFAISGAPYVGFGFNQSVLPAHCGSASNGTAIVSVTGGAKPFTYLWDNGQTTPTASGLTAGTYNLKVTDSNTCVHNLSVTVGYVTPVPVTAAATKTNICSNDTITLYIDTTVAGYTPGTYTWSPGGLKGTAVKTVPGNIAAYTVYAEDDYGCTSTAAVNLTIATAPTGTFTVNPDSACLGTNQLITYTGTGSATAAYNWNFGGAAVQYGAAAGPYSILYKTAGLHDITLKVTENGCTSTLVTHTTMIYAALATPVVKVLSETSTTITFGWDPVPGATGYIVSVNGSVYIVPTSGSLGTTHTLVNLQPLESATISVIALGVETCRNSMEGKATGTTKTDEIFIPNSFSPNSDGKNDEFKVYGTIIASMQMRIFNQWGQLIFETSDYTQGWDGKYKGTLQPMGVYMYAVRIKLNNGEEVTRKGTVNLLH